MSFVTVAPEFVGQAAADLEGIGSTLSSANAAAAPTTGVIAPGADEVSLAITALFGTHARQYQALSAQAATFHSQFVSMLNAGAGSHVSTDVANAQQSLVNALNAPGQALLGHPLIGTGTGRLAAALKAAEPELAKGESELLMAGRTAVAGVAELRPAVADLVHAGGAFISAGNDAVAGLTNLESSATELVQGVDDIVMAGGSAASGLGLLGSAVGELVNPATIALAVPSALRGLGLLGTAAAELGSGVHDLTLFGQDAVAGIAALQSASAEFAQGVSDVMLAGQDAATGLATLQSAGADFVEGVTDVEMAADAAATALGF